MHNMKMKNRESHNEIVRVERSVIHVCSISLDSCRYSLFSFFKFSSAFVNRIISEDAIKSCLQFLALRQGPVGLLLVIEYDRLELISISALCLVIIKLLKSLTTQYLLLRRTKTTLQNTKQQNVELEKPNILTQY